MYYCSVFPIIDNPESSPATFWFYYSVQSQHIGHLSLLLHQSWNRISIHSLLNLTWLSIIVSLCVYVDYTKNVKGALIMNKMTEQSEKWQEAQTHIIRDFLSQVSLCDEDLGDFLTGSVKHTSHQWVFTILKPGPLYRVIDKENKWPQSHIHRHFWWQNHNESYNLPPDSCTIYRTNSSDLFSTLQHTNTDYL